MAVSKNAQLLIDKLQLEPHPEGGFYRRVYASPDKLIDDTDLLRHKLTSIYYLLCGQDVSVFHQLDASEIWYYLEGSCALEIHELTASGVHMETKIDPQSNTYLYGVQPNTLFAARLSKQTECDYVLVACAVGPGFEFSRYEMPTRQVLLARYPQHQTLIESFTASDS